MLVSRRHPGVAVSENLHDRALRNARHCEGTGRVVTEVVKPEVFESEATDQTPNARVIASGLRSGNTGASGLSGRGMAESAALSVSVMSDPHLWQELSNAG